MSEIKTTRNVFLLVASWTNGSALYPNVARLIVRNDTQVADLLFANEDQRFKDSDTIHLVESLLQAVNKEYSGTPQQVTYALWVQDDNAKQAIAGFRHLIAVDPYQSLSAKYRITGELASGDIEATKERYKEQYGESLEVCDA